MAVLICKGSNRPRHGLKKFKVFDGLTQSFSMNCFVTLAHVRWHGQQAVLRKVLDLDFRQTMLLCGVWPTIVVL